MADHELQKRRVDTAIEYFRLVDNPDPSILDLFTDDVEVFFPKLGTAVGKEKAGRLALALATEFPTIKHDVANFNIIASGEHVVVEGRAEGMTRNGTAFPDGIYSQGLFCDVFEFEGDLIKRVSIYEDPDFTSADTERVDWAKSFHEIL